MENLARSRARSQKRARVLASLSVGAVATVMSVGAVLYWPRATANVRITKPGSGETIALPATLAGRASGLRRGQHLGLGACFDDSRCFIYFDQNIAVKKGDWSAPMVMFGEPGDAGKSVTLLAFVTTDAQRSAFEDYLRNPPRRPVCRISEENVARIADRVTATVAPEQVFPSWGPLAGLPLCVPPPRPQESPPILERVMRWVLPPVLGATASCFVNWFLSTRRRKMRHGRPA
jgi:hypothetical protein